MPNCLKDCEPKLTGGTSSPYCHEFRKQTGVSENGDPVYTICGARLEQAAGAKSPHFVGKCVLKEQLLPAQTPEI